jgi:Txe/YoeB family toxin of toxin-antitoxin system
VTRRPWRAVYTKQAKRDARRIAEAGLRENAQALLDLLAENPLRPRPPLAALAGDLAGAISRRVTIQHRLVYQVLRKERTVKVLRLWTHYE